MLDVRRMKQGKAKFRKEEISLVEVVEEVSQAFLVLFQEKGITFTFSPLSKNKNKVLADPFATRRIFINLLGNACKFTPQGGKISITITENSEEFLNVSISDTGIGIPPEKLEYIFDEFYTIDSQESETQKGSGLGLTIVKNIIEGMGGKISVTSVVGAGTTFSFLLPKYHE